MMPLILKLRKARHKEVAIAQDLIVEELYTVFERAVLHGGTAIWRCYQGNRFSEDIDAYLPRDLPKVNVFFENLEKKGFSIIKKKISEHSIFSELQLKSVAVRFEAIFKQKDGSLKEYETTDGNLITVYTLTPEELVAEKINAYLARLKIRDLYDVFFLLRHVKSKEEVAKDVGKLLNNFKSPADKDELKVLIITGLVPDVKKMLDYIKRWI
jgi:predicted nucleotidyltransferase component of viral defense system